METFKLEIKLDNAAFEGESLAAEIADCLNNLAERIRGQNRAYLAGNGSRMYLRDSNGNNVGFAYFNLNDDGEY